MNNEEEDEFRIIDYELWIINGGKDNLQITKDEFRVINYE
jgi:hypothetical protein